MKLKVVRVVTASYVVPWHLSNTLKRMTADFEVCVVGQGVSANKDAFPDVKFVDININRKTSLIADGAALFQLCKFLLAYKPDIVHSIMPKAGLLTAIAGFICRIPVRIHTFTGQTWVAKKGYSRHFYYALDRLINWANTICLTDSISQSAFLMENGISGSGQPLPVLSKGSLSGVEISRFNVANFKEDAEQLRTTLGLEDSYFVFTFLARKTKAKGAIDILKAFAAISPAIPQARLLFVGPDEDGEIALVKKADPQLFENVIEEDHVSNPEVYLAISDVLCLPSYREGFGSIVIDAAAIGVPSIGSRIPGLTDSIADKETGLLFTAGDTKELEELMMTIANSPDLCKTLGENAKKRVEKYFTADQLYLALKEFYLQYASKNKVTSKKI